MRWTLMALMACGATDEGPLGVNEVGADWVEIYNGTVTAMPVDDWTITPEGEAPERIAGEVPAGSTLLVALGRPLDDRVLIVADPDGTTVQTITVPPFVGEVSFGRLPDGIANWQLLADPSPGALNQP